MPKTEILGIGGLTASFARLRDDMQQRTSRAMVVSAGGVIKRGAKALAGAHRRTGAMEKNIAIKREPTPAGVAVYHLGVRNGHSLTRKQKQDYKLVVTDKGRIAKRYEDNPFYWRFVHLGTKHIQADPFLSRALEANSAAAIEAMAARLQAEYLKTLKPT